MAQFDLLVGRDNPDQPQKRRIKKTSDGACRGDAEKGLWVIIYPEGGRAYDGVMREFKAGVGKLHLDSGVPVLPAAFKGTREIFAAARQN